MDSLKRLAELTALCDELGVHTQPKRLGKAWIVPIFSWYHNSFDSEPDLAIAQGHRIAQDVRRHPHNYNKCSNKNKKKKAKRQQ